MATTRVLIVDDHEIFRGGLSQLLEPEADVEVVGEAGNAEEAINMAAELQPEVVIMDVRMPGGMNGIDATRAIVNTSPHICVLILTMEEDESDDETLFAALRAGARGFLLKSGPSDEIRSAVRLRGGTALFGQGVAHRILEYFATAPRTAPQAIFPELTEREREILTLIAEGEGNQAIARRLYISQKTVRNHVSNIFSKLQVSDRAKAIVRARKAGLTGE